MLYYPLEKLKHCGSVPQSAAGLNPGTRQKALSNGIYPKSKNLYYHYG
jgi:hypothetical protein